MNEQALFDAALAHIRKQGKPSISDDGQCRYRHADGLGCAFAPAIASYTDDMEGLAADTLLTGWADAIKPEFRSVDPNFAGLVQTAHDDADEDDFMPSFERRMKDLAVEWNLTYTEPS